MAGQGHPDGHTEMRADPGMVLNYKAQEEAPPAPPVAQPDLLDFDGLSMDAPPPAGAQASILLHSLMHIFDGDRPDMQGYSLVARK